jgi:hypothetical protein
MKERGAAMTRFGEALRGHEARLRELAVTEAGCPINSTVMGAQVDAPLRMTDEIIDMFLKLPELEENPLPLHERVNPYFVVQSLKKWSPLGVVSAISAYNVPFYTAFWKVVPALMAGDSVVLRPNPLTPISALIFAEAAEEAGIPRGVLNVVLEGGLDGGQLMTTDRRGRPRQLHRLLHGRRQGGPAGRAHLEAAGARTGRQVGADFPARCGGTRRDAGVPGMHFARGAGLRAGHPGVRAAGSQGRGTRRHGGGGRQREDRRGQRSRNPAWPGDQRRAARALRTLYPGGSRCRGARRHRRQAARRTWTRAISSSRPCWTCPTMPIPPRRRRSSAR